MAKREEAPLGAQVTAAGRREQERYWRRILKEQQRSGVCQAEFCRQNAIPKGRYFWWKREIARRDGRLKARRRGKRGPTSDKASLVPVRITSRRETVAQSISLVADPRFEIVLRNGCVVKVPQVHNGETLRSIVEMLGDLC